MLVQFGFFTVGWIILRTIGIWFPMYTVLPEAACVLGMLVYIYAEGKKAGVDMFGDELKGSLGDFTKGILAGIDLERDLTGTCEDCDGQEYCEAVRAARSDDAAST